MMQELKKYIGGDIELTLDNISSTVCNTIPDRTSFYASGRSALGAILESTRCKSVLIPSYICPSLYEYIKSKSLQVSIYPVDCRLRVRLDYLEGMIHPGSCDAAIIVIDYFGVVSNDEDVKAIKTSFPYLTIIRDYSHNPYKILSPQARNEEIISFASLRKFFPFPDGGISNIKGVGIGESNPLSLGATVQIASKCLRSLYLKTPNESIEWVEDLYLGLHELAEQMLDSGETGMGISNFTLSLLQHLDLGSFKKARKSNYNHLRSALLSCNQEIDLTLAQELPSGQVPYMLPLLFRDKTIRDLVKNNLHQNHIYCPILWKQDSDESHSIDENSLSISDRILCLPVDQRYTGSDMMKIFETLMVCITQYY